MVDDNYEINELFDLEVVLEDGQKAEKLVLVDESGESTLSVNIIKSLKILSKQQMSLRKMNHLRFWGSFKNIQISLEII
ncbi:hypothetical protein [Aliivibrio finisterrensis]|uniref:Uncharacterized protein n=1 Tax=Aliivibrio finisterrensis TaxID=511998 RepID=A0A6N6RNM0_9GAMM|nr:hypothetical protein [Aliivibrio finisterrensis]KAB2823024.1 hypothetical protein F8B77_17200 [Aliivibrio finisterrensis]